MNILHFRMTFSKKFIFIAICTTVIFSLFVKNMYYEGYLDSLKTSILVSDTDVNDLRQQDLESHFVENLSQEKESTCKLPDYKTKQQCLDINNRNKDGPCSYYCGCHHYTELFLPGQFPVPLSPPVQDMSRVEAMTFNDPEFLNINATASVKHSKLSCLTPVEDLHVGDEFKVAIQLVDGVGRPRRQGGDDVRVWLKSSDSVFKAVGNVVDLSNGTYVATLKAIWEGKSFVYVKLAYTREELATRLRWYRQYGMLYYQKGQYKKAGISENVLCSFFQTIPGYGKLCNFTKLNNGQPWYCVKPTNPKLGCEDIHVFSDFDNNHIPQTRAQTDLIINRKPSDRILKTRLKVDISNGQLSKPNKSCNILDPRQTWNTTMPTGYFNGSQWISFQCRNNLNKSSFDSCLHNIHVVIMGDSTCRQYFTYITSKIIHDCELITEKWTHPLWHKPSTCVSESRNLSISWNPHEMPFSDAFVSKGELNLKSTARVLNELPTDRKVLFVIHYYVHMIRQHITLVLHAIRNLKSAIKKALSRNKNLVIALKSPHAFEETHCVLNYGDFAGPIFIEILKRELDEFKDSILFLNAWEMNVASQNTKVHPNDDIVGENVRMLFGYVCASKG